MSSADFSPNSQWLINASGDSTARVWNVATGEPVIAPLRHRMRDVWAEFGPDGRRCATASHDGTVRVWDAGTGEPLTTPLLE